MREITRGHGVDVVIEAAGDPRAVPQALDLVRDGGRVVIAGQYTDGGDVSINPHLQINRKHAEIRGCWGCDYSHVHRALQILAHQGHALPWADSITARFGIDAGERGARGGGAQDGDQGADRAVRSRDLLYAVRRGKQFNRIANNPGSPNMRCWAIVIVLLLASPARGQSPAFDIVIANGRVIDPESKARRGPVDRHPGRQGRRDLRRDH